MDNTLSYQKTIDELLEFKRLVSKLEDALEKKEMELANVIKVYQDLKSLYEKTGAECNDLNQRLLAVYAEKSAMEKKYEAENQRLKSFFDKQKETYESQILKLRSYDTIALKNKLTTEAEIKYTQIITRKDFEMDNLQDKLKQTIREKEGIAQEYQQFKEEKTTEITSINLNHKQELKELINKIEMTNLAKEQSKDYNDLKYYHIEMDTMRKKIMELTTSLLTLQNEKELAIAEMNSQKTILYKEIEGEKFKKELVEKENSQLNTSLKALQTELSILKQKNSSIIDEVNNFKTERDYLIKELNNKQVEFGVFKEEIQKLRELLESHDKETSDIIKDHEEKFQHRFNDIKNEKTDYQNQIENLNGKLMEIRINYKDYHEAKTKETDELQKEYYILQEEKKMLIQRQNDIQNEIGMLRNDYEKKSRAFAYYEQEYLALDQRYRDLSMSSSEKEQQIKMTKNQLNEKDREMENLNSYIDKLKKEHKLLANSDINKKYKELLKKKQFYKAKCKKCNENIAFIINKLSPKDQKELELHQDLLKEISQSEDSMA